MATRWQSTLSGSNFRRVRASTLACVILAGLACGCKADPDPPDRESVEMLAAHAAARAALIDLRLAGTPKPTDYRVAQELLGVAARLADAAEANLDATRKSMGVADQQTMYRLYLEAATGADDVAAIRRIVGRLVQIDPQDTVSQLRLISAKISDFQTADQRLAAYENFLGPAGEVFDDSVRSRLALDAALLLRERGDTEGFVDKLDLALRLDSTNKDAALLGLTFYSQRLTDSTAILEWKLCVLGADPFDVSVYSSIVEQLLAEGAYNGAYHFAKLHRQLCSVQGRSATESDERAFDLSEWNSSGPDAVLRRLSDLLEKARQRAFEQRKLAQEQGLPTDGMPRPEEMRLPFARERSRVLCAAAIPDRERASVFIGELSETVRIGTEEAMDPARRPAGLSEEQARAASRIAATELAWLRLWADVQVSEAAATVKELIAAGAIDGAGRTRFEAWIDLRTGATERADAALRSIAESDPYGALGLALLSELQSDESTAVVRYRDLAWRSPGTEVGAFAATRYLKLTRERPRPSDVARELEAYAAGVPRWLDTMVENPRRIMTLEASALRTEMSPVDRTPVRVTLRNTSERPLAVGPESPLNSRLLFAPNIEVGSARLPSSEFGHVVSLDRRLRLLKNESFDIVTYPDIGVMSHIAELGLPKQARIRRRVLQGFQLVDQRMYDAGPQCLTTEVPVMLRRLPNRSDSVYAALQYALQTGGPREIADAILSVKYQLSLPKPPLTPSEVDRLMEVIARRFGSMQRASKVMVLCLVPTQANLPQVRRIDQLLVQETDEDVLAVSLATRVVKADDPLFSAQGVVKSPHLVALAQLVQDRLAAGARTFATAPLDAPELIGGMRPASSPDAPKPLTLDVPKPEDTPGAGPAGARAVRAGPVDPPDTSPVPVLP